MKEIISLAPGRTCLFGDHQDYMHLPIIACAINRQITLKAVENNSEAFHISMPDVEQERTISINTWSKDFEAKGDYFIAALKVLKKHGCVATKGYNISISGNIPINSGLSSSSALLVSWVNFLANTFGCNQEITRRFISEITYEAEVMEQESSGGRMDQYAIGVGKIIYLETDNNCHFEIINHQLAGLIVGDSGIPKDTHGVLKHLKDNSLLAIEKVQASAPDFILKEARIKDIKNYLPLLPDHLQSYFIAAISNHDITQRALIEFQKQELDYKKIGDLINQHHQILKDVLEITVPRIDDMIDAALQAGAYGAKIVGSGKGGSIIAFAPKEKEEAVIAAIKNAKAANAYAVNVDNGARIISN
ncbi:MAG: galactokinase [Flavobacteriales bacterium]|nr:galactokinase [Flavobacteriales bacterium]